MSKQYDLPADAVWFITGGSSGIGKAFLNHLSRTSYRVVAVARQLSALDYIPESTNVLKVILDVTSPTAIRAAVAKTVDKFGRIDVLVNNVAYSLLGDTETTTDEEARLLFDTNFWGATSLIREVVRVMRQDNPKTGQIGGVIGFMSSTGARVAFPGGSYYYATRFAMEGFMESFQAEVSPAWNIHFMIAEPGGVKTDYLQKSVVLTERHPAYGDDPAGATNQLLDMLKNKAMVETFPEPDTLVEVIIDTVKNGIDGLGIPLRLPLGADSWTMLNGNLAKSMKDHQALKTTAFRTTSDAGALGELGKALEGSAGSK
ncbi:hypothetical protein LTR84_004105 [Exophiala bonariae]|uniref:Uncharacterized protein n=1 Tax=Exophiala bonariae TaxID=1690606 RepID=A0AAV9N8T9_9EURO|nr:hypothetical protein LTR84_004105 [Exophiala bonariae]